MRLIVLASLLLFSSVSFSQILSDVDGYEYSVVVWVSANRGDIDSLKAKVEEQLYSAGMVEDACDKAGIDYVFWKAPFILNRIKVKYNKEVDMMDMDGLYFEISYQDTSQRRVVSLLDTLLHQWSVEYNERRTTKLKIEHVSLEKLLSNYKIRLKELQDSLREDPSNELLESEMYDVADSFKQKQQKLIHIKSEMEAILPPYYIVKHKKPVKTVIKKYV